jgi:predicted lactoylglutathione lyase
MVFSDTIFVMIMTRERFAGFCPKDKVVANALSIEGNAKAVSEVLLFLSADSKEEVDEILEKAGKAGGKKDPTTFPEADFMYGRSFEDLDGHVFEIGYMDMEKMKEGGHKTCE